jgi:hypothetical protein
MHALPRVLEERQILFSLHKKDLKMWEAKPAEEQACNLYSFIERDLSAELEEHHACAA